MSYSLPASLCTYPLENLACLMIGRQPIHKRPAQVKLLNDAGSPVEVIEAWAAINYFNSALHNRIKKLTGWNVDQANSRCARLQWTRRGSTVGEDRRPDYCTHKDKTSQRKDPATIQTTLDTNGGKSNLVRIGRGNTG